MKLDVDVSAPVVVVPSNSASKRYLVAHLGRLVVNNSIETKYGESEEKFSRYDVIRAGFTNVKVLM